MRLGRRHQASVFRPPPEVWIGIGANLFIMFHRSAACEGMARMAGPIVQIAHLVSRIDACDREIRNLNVSHVRPLLEGASPVIAILLGDAIVSSNITGMRRD
jgi:hypothetical protein